MCLCGGGFKMLGLAGKRPHAQKGDDPSVAYDPEIRGIRMMPNRSTAQLHGLLVVRQRLLGRQSVAERGGRETCLDGE